MTIHESQALPAFQLPQELLMTRKRIEAALEILLIAL